MNRPDIEISTLRPERQRWSVESGTLAGLADQGYLAAFACVFAGWVILALPWLTGRVILPYDAEAHFYPQLQFLAHALHSGDSPFWTPNVFGGSPQIADPQSLIFSPALLLAYFDGAPSMRAFAVYVFAVVLAGCLAVLMIFKDRGWHPAAGVMAALAFGFGASANARIQHVTQVQGLVFFMLALWLLSRALDRRSPLYGVLAGGAAALMLMEPGQVQLLGAFLLAGYVVSHWVMSPDWRQSMRQSVKPLAAAALMVIVFATIPVVLTYLFGLSSSRPVIAFAANTGTSLHPASLLTAIVADLFGANDPTVTYWGPGTFGWNGSEGLAQNMGQIYMGALPMLALLALIVARPAQWHRDVKFLGIGLGFCLLYALGTNTPAFRIFYDLLPGVPLFRRPADATFFIGALSALAAGYCLHLALTNGIRKIGSVQLIILAGTLAVIFALCLAVASSHAQLHNAMRPVAASCAFAAAALGLIYASQRMQLLPASFVVLLVAGFMVLDLGINAKPNESTGHAVSRTSPFNPGTLNTVVTYLKTRTQPALPSDRRDRVELLGVGFSWPNSGLTHGFDHTLGYNPLRLREVEDTLGAGDTIAVPQQRYYTPLFSSYHSVMADLMGLRYIVSPVAVESIDKALKPGDLTQLVRTPDGTIYENAGALPRVMFLSKWRVADFPTLTRTGRWPDVDPRETVLLPNAPIMPAARTSDLRGQPAGAKLMAYRNTQVDVEVNADKPGFVVLNDVWHPWWFAEVDGKPTPIFRANVLFRAVAVPAGRHRVQFSFRPIKGAMAQLGSMMFGGRK
ncbi:MULTISPECIES: YfhO family protein [Rhodomicrobium]|uniref:YfhO family protein n=1 Tax=Rhodomicrobium TaxID=1068 RepID=UPI0014835FA9|nr:MULTISPECIES: YfhO family protein [Rhodomicrobium]